MVGVRLVKGINRFGDNVLAHKQGILQGLPRAHKKKDPANHAFRNSPIVLGLRTRMGDPYASVVFGAPTKRQPGCPLAMFIMLPLLLLGIGGLRRGHRRPSLLRGSETQNGLLRGHRTKLMGSFQKSGALVLCKP